MKHIFSIIVSLLVMSSCHNKKANDFKDTISTSVMEYNMDSMLIDADSSIYNLKSYSLNSFLPQNNSIYGYNYKTHAIDIINLNDRGLLNTIKLNRQGPNAIANRVCAIDVIASDSIALYDGTAICLINSEGLLIEKFELPENGFSQIQTNSRAAIAGFNIDFDSHSILYPIRNDDKFEILQYNFQTDSIEWRLKLHGPVNQGKHGFMRIPNISFDLPNIIYNYPFENEVFVYNLAADTTSIVNPISNFIEGPMEAYNGSSIEDLTWYGIENFFYTCLYKISDKNIYVRLALGGSKLGRNEKPEKAMQTRPLYAMYFDRDLTPIGEISLPEHRYDPYGGWCVTPTAIILFRYNLFGNYNEENVMIDIPKPIYY